jgi:hypothetical protein
MNFDMFVEILLALEGSALRISKIARSVRDPMYRLRVDPHVTYLIRTHGWMLIFDVVLQIGPLGK